MRGERLPAALAILASQAPTRRLRTGDRVVVFSDLHLGNGGRRDDFLPNGELLSAALRRYYLPRRYTLVLNGDVEELQRFHLADIRRRWSAFYELLAQFARQDRLERLIGNHDAELAVLRDSYPAPRLLEALRLELGKDSLLLFHGHQASYLQTYFLGLVSALLRYVANPLGIHNFSVSRSNLRRFRVEKRVYSFAHAHRQLVLIGHTHRPLFESLSRLDALRFRIEVLCRQIPSAGGRRRAALEGELAARKEKLEQVLAKRGRAEGRHAVHLAAVGALPVQLRLLHRAARPHGAGDRRRVDRPGALVRPQPQRALPGFAGAGGVPGGRPLPSGRAGAGFPRLPAHARPPAVLKRKAPVKAGVGHSLGLTAG